jgi:enoyl-CoA hydratase/carnithine racemase
MNAPQTPAQLEPLLLEQRSPEGVVTLTLNRPAQFNSLSEEMLAALQAAFDRIGADATARVIVIAAAGKAFCAGHDLKQMKANPR